MAPERREMRFKCESCGEVTIITAEQLEELAAKLKDAGPAARGIVDCTGGCGKTRWLLVFQPDGVLTQ